MLARLRESGVTVHADDRARAIFPDSVPVTEEDWGTEHMSLDIAVRVVGGAQYINALVGDGVNALLEAPGIGTNDGPGYGRLAGNRLDVTANGIAKEFPFLPTPYSGRN